MRLRSKAALRFSVAIFRNDDDRLELLLTLADFVDAVGRDRSAEALHQAASRPPDLQRIDRGRLAEPDVRTQARRAEAAAAVHGPEDLARLALLGRLHADARSRSEEHT